MNTPDNSLNISVISDKHFEKIIDDLSEQGFSVIDNFLSIHDVSELTERLSRLEQDGDFYKAGIGSQENYQIKKDFRGDYIRWIDPDKAAEPTKNFLEKMSDLRENINRYCFTSLKDYEAHFTIYPTGTFYKRHLDVLNNDDHRKISVICYLNINWQKEHGGILRLYLPQPDGSEQNYDILPEAGKLVCFRSSLIEHEVLACKRPRFSITGWFLDKLIDLKSLI